MADTSKITVLNGASYEFEYKLSNSSGEISFNDSAVESLTITDNVFNPFADATIVIVNSYNFIESLYTLRGDGTDKLHIKLTNTSDRTKTIEYTFIVVSEQNMIDDATEAKNRKMYILAHEDDVKLRKKFTYRLRGRGSVGSIIKDLLKSADLKTSDEVWENGDHIITNFPEYIIPAASYRYLDLMYYLLKYYYYIDGDVAVKGFMSKGEDGYELKVLSKDFFTKNKELVYETFHAGDLVSKFQSNPNNPTGANFDGPYNIYNNNIVSNNLSTPAMDYSNTYYMNALVSGYDPILGSSRMIEVRLDDTRKKWEKKFVDVFQSVGGEVKRHLNLTSTKKEEEFKLFRLPFNIVDSAKLVEADMVNSFVFYNQQLNINVQGDLGRRSGVFVDLFKAKNDKIKTDEKLLGRWFVTSVRHVKLKNTLRSEIYCVKTYAGPNYNSEDV